jgi:hypothetical protein
MDASLAGPEQMDASLAGPDRLLPGGLVHIVHIAMTPAQQPSLRSLAFLDDVMLV